MSTSATITLKNLYRDDEERVVCRIRRDLGGHPTECGIDVAEAVIAASDTLQRTYPFSGRCVRLTNRNWAQHFLKELCADRVDLEFVDEDHLDAADYEYVVTGSYDEGVELYSLTPDEYRYRIDVECSSDGRMLFCGSAYTFRDWCLEPSR